MWILKTVSIIATSVLLSVVASVYKHNRDFQKQDDLYDAWKSPDLDKSCFNHYFNWNF